MSEIKGNCCDIWTLRGAGAAGAAGPGPDQVGGAEPQPLLGPGALSPPCSRRCGGLWARPTVHSPEFLFSLLTSGAAKHLNASSSFLRPWCSPPPPAAIRSQRGPASTGRSARGGPQPPPPPPARLSDTLPSFRLTPQRGPSPLSSPPRFFHITVPFFLDTHPAPRAAVVLSAQEKQGKERKEPHKAGVSRGHRGGLRTRRSRVPERCLTGPSSLAGWSSDPGSPAPRRRVVEPRPPLSGGRR